MTFDYSIAIRTLGRAGDKYERLIESINLQTIKPKNVYVAIDNEELIEALPKCGLEQFIVKPRGMLKQRIYGIEANDSEWLLMLDDDVEFDSDFVEHMWLTAQQSDSKVVIPCVRTSGEENIEAREPSVFDHAKSWLMGIRYTGNISPYLIKIADTGGFIYSNEIRPGVQYFSQSGHGTCCFAHKQALDKLHFEEELWLENTPYALPDDQVMFYKLWLTGAKIAVDSSVRFIHLDAQSGNPKEDKAIKIAYASAHNCYVFWHRFLYLPERSELRRLRKRMAIARREFFTCGFALAKGLKNRNLSKYRIYRKAYKDAKLFIKSKEYKCLPLVEDNHITP